MAKINVLMPVFNSVQRNGNMIHTALQSLLNQTFTDFKLSILDNISDDETPDISDLIERMIQADAWIVVAPEYNGSMPPTLNNAIAWISRDWQNFRKMCTGKPVGLATHSGGGGDHVIMAMRQQFSYIGADVIGRACVSGRNKEANPDTIDAMITNLAN